MSLPTIYVKNNQEVSVSPKFVYCSSVYKIWKRGASLLEEKYYASNTPLILSKSNRKITKKGYIIQRFLDLESAPADYLINNGYKLKKL